MGRKNRTEGKEDALAMVEAADSSSRVWGMMRKLFSAQVRERVDLVADVGGLSLHDIELLEFANHENMTERIKRLERKSMTATAISTLESVRLQSRKHLRVLRCAMNPITDPNGQRHPEPDSEARKAAARERLANAPEATTTVTDTGDELVN